VAVEAQDATSGLLDFPKMLVYTRACCGGVAQLARAFGSYPKGRGFKPLCRYLNIDNNFYRSSLRISEAFLFFSETRFLLCRKFLILVNVLRQTS
jgi:hypothetical protein